MILLLKILFGIAAAVLLTLGLIWMFKPEIIMKELDIETATPTGKNFLRGDIGGLLMSVVIIIILFFYTSDRLWLVPLIIITITVMFGRVISLIMDGKSKRGLEALIGEALILILIFLLYNNM